MGMPAKTRRQIETTNSGIPGVKMNSSKKHVRVASVKVTLKPTLSSRKATRPVKRHDVVSFFAGCGGMDLGFLGGFDYMELRVRKLPFNIVTAYDFNEKCVETWTVPSSHHRIRRQ
jgi:hypothetical protein